MTSSERRSRAEGPFRGGNIMHLRLMQRPLRLMTAQRAVLRQDGTAGFRWSQSGWRL